MCVKAGFPFLFALLAVSSTGCATLFAGGPDRVLVSSDPDGASVRLDGVPVGTTPCHVDMPRGGEGVFSFELKGYEEKTLDVDKVVNGITFVNAAWILFWPMVPVSLGIDVVTGNVSKYSTDPIFVRLDEKPRAKGRRRPGDPRLSSR